MQLRRIILYAKSDRPPASKTKGQSSIKPNKDSLSTGVFTLSRGLLAIISETPAKSRTIAESKIIHKSPILHSLARFVNEETVALLFNIAADEIYRIECCHYMVYVHAKGLSRFVSYADFPPILEVKPIAPQDFRRWYKRWKSKQATAFWTKFYTYNFKKAVSVDSLLEWDQLVATVKDVYAQEKDLMDKI